MKFEDYNFHPELIKGILKLGLRRPTDIQYKSIPAIMRGEDVLAVAQTGTGKTAAFAIPTLHQLHVNKKRARRPDGVKCLIMVPTHELALQVAEVFNDLGDNTAVKTLAIIGGVEQDPQIKSLHKGVDAVVATPGRLFDLISQGHLRVQRVQTLILDEADRMLELGFLEDIQQLIRKLPARRQTLFFSATINNRIKKLAYSLIRQNAIRIQISPKDPVSRNVEHAIAFIAMDDKRFFLERLLKEHPDSKVLVFVRTKVRAERVSKAMKRVGLEAPALHGDKEQEERNELLAKFKEGGIRVLVATDVSARGIDVPGVEYVLNYDLPEQAPNYVHRVGRTGRGNQQGKAVSFCSPNEEPLLGEIEAYLGQPITRLDIDVSTYENTKLFSEDQSGQLDELLQEIELLEELKRKKRKSKGKH